MDGESVPQDTTAVSSSVGLGENTPLGAVDAGNIPSRPTPNTGRPPLSPLTHILIFASVLTPIALLPYLAVRSHLLSLHRKVGDLSAANAALRRDLKTTLLESSIRREEHDRLRALLEETRRDMEKVKAEGARREVAKATADERIRRDIQDLLVERQKTRWVIYRPLPKGRPNVLAFVRIRAGLSTLRDMSSSLADIAAFMHEVEVQQGFVSRKNDGRGIERIRQLAYKLQGLSVDTDVSKLIHGTMSRLLLNLRKPATTRQTPGDEVPKDSDKS